MEENIKTILVLGGYGFIATNVIKYIETHRLPYRIIVFDIAEQHPHGVTSPVIIKSYNGDFANSILLERIFQENPIDVVFHSISTTVASNANNPRYDVQTNVLPSLSVMDLMVKYKVKDIIFLSSGGAIYGETRGHAHLENDDVFPKSPYGVSKLTIEKYLMLYATLYGIKPLILRLSNPYGFYHYSTKQGVINVALRCAKNGQVFNVYGDGNGRKDYIWVEDFVRILFQLISLNVHNEVVNISSGELLSVNEILFSIRKLYPNFEWIYKHSLTLDVQNFELNNSKLIRILGDVHFTSFNDAIHILEQDIK